MRESSQKDILIFEHPRFYIFRLVYSTCRRTRICTRINSSYVYAVCIKKEPRILHLMKVNYPAIAAGFLIATKVENEVDL